LFAISPRLRGLSREHEFVSQVSATTADDDLNAGKSERRDRSNPYPREQALHF